MSRGLRFDLPTIVEDDEEDSVIPSNGVAILNNKIADRVNTTYQGVRFVFTINNPPENSPDWGSVSDFGDWFVEKYKARFVYWCLEKGALGTPHIQGYFELKKDTRISSMKNKFRSRALSGWVAVAKGTAQDSIDYIGHTGDFNDKEGLVEGPWSVGSVMVKGQRTELEAVATAIRGGASLKTLAREHTSTMLRVFNNARNLIALLDERERDWMTELYIYTGIAGSGKSHAAHQEAKQYLRDNNIDEKPYDLMVPGKNQPLWWQGYTGQAVVIIDDFYGTISIDEIKRLIDT